MSIGEHFPRTIRSVASTAKHHIVFERGHDAQLVEERTNGSQLIGWYARMSLQQLVGRYMKNDYLQIVFYGSTPQDLMRALNEFCNVELFKVEEFLKFQVKKLADGQAKVITLTARADSKVLRGTIQLVISRPSLKEN